MKRLVSLLILGLTPVTFAAAGEIKGKVTFEGEAPKMKPIVAMEGNPDCALIHGGEYPVFDFIQINDAGEIQNVLVRIVSGLPAGVEYPAPAEPVVLSQQGCVYSPHVFVVQRGQTLRIENPDKILHNIKALPVENTPFNKSTSKERPEVEVVFDKTEAPFPFQCDVHGWMQAWCTVVDHPYFAVTDATGAFEIKDLPPGEYEVEFWHERLGTQTKTVTVPGELNVVFTRPGAK